MTKPSNLTVDTARQTRVNNFDLLRIFAALQVVWVHMIDHLHPDPVGVAKGIDTFLRFFSGVPIFFTISGFLIAMSFERSPALRRYCINRILRIYPGLWFSFVVTLIILGWFGYLQPAITGRPQFFVWVLAQLSFLQLYNPDFLRSFGVGVVNGSLWTIPIEIEFYIVLPFILLALRKVQGRSKKNLILIGLIVLSSITYPYLRYGPQNKEFLVRALYGTLLPHLFEFLIGVIIFFNIDVLLKWFEGRFLVWFTAYVAYRYLFGVLLDLPLEQEYFLMMITDILRAGLMMSFVFSWRTLSTKILHHNDISYGVYIYHVLMINIMVELGYTGKYVWFIPVVIATVCLAWLSWKFVEAPALRLKGRASSTTQQASKALS